MRKETSHKGENGVVLIVAGSELYVGSAIFACMAALKTGIDLVYLAAPRFVSEVANVYSPDIISLKLDGKFLKKSHCKQIIELSKKCDCVLIGPGLGMEKETVEAVRILTKNIKKPMILDADALKSKPTLHSCIVTPHAKEFEVLFGEDATRDAAMRHARKDLIVLLKSPIADIITDGKRLKLNRTGNAGMTVGGTGDLLAGITAGLVSKKLSLFDSAAKAAYINGLAGDAQQKKKPVFLASDMIEEIPQIIKRLKL